MRRDIWTEAETENLRRMWSARVPREAIAAALGRSTSAVNNKRVQLGLPARHDGGTPDQWWPPDRAAELAVLWGQGLSARQIAAQMGMTRNAVIGKARRMGLAARPSPIPGFRSREDRGMPTQLPQGRCQFIAGQPSEDDACKCGAAVQPGSAYCPPHHKRCYTGVPKRAPGTMPVLVDLLTFNTKGRRHAA